MKIFTVSLNNLGVPMVLGNKFFSRMVLTIDWKAQQLLIRTLDYDLTKKKLKPGACMVDFSWGGQNPVGPGFPIISAVLSGKPVRLAFDTGGNVLSITEKLGKSLDYSKGHEEDCTITSALGTAKRRLISFSSLPLVLGDITCNSSVKVLPTLDGSSDGLLPAICFRNYLTTIDYKRRKILFEPYPVK